MSTFFGVQKLSVSKNFGVRKSDVNFNIWTGKYGESIVGDQFATIAPNVNSRGPIVEGSRTI